MFYRKAADKTLYVLDIGRTYYWLRQTKVKSFSRVGKLEGGRVYRFDIIILQGQGLH